MECRRERKEKAKGKTRDRGGRVVKTQKYLFEKRGDMKKWRTRRGNRKSERERQEELLGEGLAWVWVQIPTFSKGAGNLALFSKSGLSAQ